MANSGSWGGVKIQLTSPDVDKAVAAVGSVLDLINAALDVGLAILRIVKTFTVPTLDPLQALLNAIIVLCQNLLHDFRSIGLYAHFGDLKLLQSTSSKNGIVGGYNAYEQRMISRLQDRRDLKRPDFENSAVLALFLYASVDVSAITGLADPTRIQSLTKFIRSFARLLGMVGILETRNNTLPTAVSLQSTFPLVPQRNPTTGTQQSAALQLAVALSQTMGRSSVIISWNIASVPVTNDPSPPIPPGGFIVEISCFPDGLYVGWMAPAQPSTGGPSGSGSTTGGQSFTTGFYKDGATGDPIKVFGGIDSINVPTAIRWSNSIDSSGNPIAGATPVYFFRDPSVPEVLPLPIQKSGTTYYNQKRFFISKAKILEQALVGGTYTLTLNRGDLPLYCPVKPDGTIDTSTATQPDVFYVRITSTTNDVTSDNFNNLSWNVVPRRQPADEQLSLSTGFDYDVIGGPSSILRVNMPSQQMDNYGLALQIALAIGFLSRSDIVPQNPLTSDTTTSSTTIDQTGLETLIRVLMPVEIRNPQDYFSLRYVSPDSFANDIYSKIIDLSNQVVAAMGNLSPTSIATLNSSINTLVNWKWSDSTVSGATGNVGINQTIMESLTLPKQNPGASAIARNYFSINGYWGPTANDPPSSYLLNLVNSSVLTVENGPIVVDYTGHKAWYARDLIPANVYNAAKSVLRLTSNVTQSTGGWTAWRPFAGTSTLATGPRVIQQIMGAMNTAAASVHGAEDAINQTISFLEQRINDIQELIKKIDEYLQLPYQISFPDLLALPLVVDSTNEIVSGLSTAQNKPQDGPGAYAAGIVLIAGGVPSPLFDLILLLIQTG